MVQQVHSYFSVKGESILALGSHRSQRPLAFKGFPNIVVVSYRLLTVMIWSVYPGYPRVIRSLLYDHLRPWTRPDPLNVVFILSIRTDFWIIIPVLSKFLRVKSHFKRIKILSLLKNLHSWMRMADFHLNGSFFFWNEIHSKEKKSHSFF